MSRHQARQVALQTLFEIDVGKVQPGLALEHTIDEAGLRGEAAAFVRQLVLGTLQELTDIDRVIGEHAVAWPLERMPNVDRNILRLGVYELTSDQETPINVIINEAVELAKTFSGDEAAKFVNGLLDHAAHSIRRVGEVSQP